LQIGIGRINVVLSYFDDKIHIPHMDAYTTMKIKGKRLQSNDRSRPTIDRLSLARTRSSSLALAHTRLPRPRSPFPAALRPRESPLAFLLPPAPFLLPLLSHGSLQAHHVYKSSKSEGVLSLKEMSTQWYGTGVIFSSAYGLQQL
jgi:hypothetical protein